MVKPKPRQKQFFATKFQCLLLLCLKQKWKGKFLYHKLKCRDFLFFSPPKIMLFHPHIKHLLTNEKTRNSFLIFLPIKKEIFFSNQTGRKDWMNPSFIFIGRREWGISSSIFLSQKHALTQENTFQRKNNKIKIRQRIKDCNNKKIIIN